jgi:hypothetical protein
MPAAHTQALPVIKVGVAIDARNDRPVAVDACSASC